MEQNLDIANKDNNIRRGMVHFVLSHSYIIFMLALVLGAIVDMIYHVKIFSNPVYQYIGFIMIILGSSVIFWSQSASKNIKKNTDQGTVYDFENGPYKYTRNPTHVGVTAMLIGFGLAINSLSNIIFTIFASIVTGLIFLKAEEKLLEKKYGQIYLDYKSKVKSWL